MRQGWLSAHTRKAHFSVQLRSAALEFELEKYIFLSLGNIFSTFSCFLHEKFEVGDLLQFIYLDQLQQINIKNYIQKVINAQRLSIKLQQEKTN